MPNNNILRVNLLGRMRANHRLINVAPNGSTLKMSSLGTLIQPDPCVIRPSQYRLIIMPNADILRVDLLGIMEISQLIDWILTDRQAKCSD